MRVMVLGVRGMLNLQGGVETHAEQLYRRLAKLGCEVEVLVRSPYVSHKRRAHGRIRLRRLWAPRWTGIEALAHSIIGVLYAAVARPDVLHIQAIGPALVTPLARLFGLRVVVTHHGPDYERDKWGAFARLILRWGESFGMRFAHARIAISRGVAARVEARYGRRCEFIPNGAVPAELERRTDELVRLGLEPRRYFVQVSRIVPEKRQLDLIEAFARVRPPKWKLALVGGMSNVGYAKRITAAAAACPGIVLAGFRNGVALKQLYSHAGAFVLPSSYEGLPIAILEALTYGLRVLASDIPANREIDLPPESYFNVGDVEGLAERLSAVSVALDDEEDREARRRWVERAYDWDSIAIKTRMVYRRVLEDPRPRRVRPPRNPFARGGAANAS